MTKEEFLKVASESKEDINNSSDKLDLLIAINKTYNSFSEMFNNCFQFSNKEQLDLKFSSNEYASKYRSQAIDKETKLEDAKEYAVAAVDVLVYIVKSIF